MPLGCGEILSAKGGEKGRQEEVGGALYGPCLTQSCLLICIALPSFTTKETSLPVPTGFASTYLTISWGCRCGSGRWGSS